MTTAENWLKTHINPLIQNPSFQNGGLLIIVFDKSGNDNAHGGGRVAWVAISPQHSKAGYKPPTLYQHQNTLRLMLQAQAPSPVLGRADTRRRPSLHHFIGMIVARGFLPGIKHCLAAFGFQSEALKRPLVMMRVGIASKAEGIARCGLPRST